jgi:hypothetical protein
MPIWTSVSTLSYYVITARGNLADYIRYPAGRNRERTIHCLQDVLKWSSFAANVTETSYPDEIPSEGIELVRISAHALTDYIGTLHPVIWAGKDIPQDAPDVLQSIFEALQRAVREANDLCRVFPKEKKSDGDGILSPQHQRALELLKSSDKPMKGLVAANKLGISLSTFRKHYVPALRPFGLKNEGDGYFVEKVNDGAT